MPKEPFLGILQVNTTFHRPPGDVGNLSTWNIPIKIKIVEEASGDAVVKTSKNYSDEFVSHWIKAAKEFVDEGAIALITSCGFLATIHPRLQSEIPIPVGTSALLQIPIAQALIHPKKKLGIITFDADNLGKEHLIAVGVDYDVPIVGVKRGGEFQQILRKGKEYDFKAIETEVLEAVDTLIRNHDIGGIILECTNIPPFKNAIYKKTGLPIWDIITLGNYLYEVSLPKNYN
ncbi:hypothetical protein BN7_5445 [Wickerhamomyces ciferrii]|uniref:Aspartate/glutamate racemase family protein n=1 Tax=Wickerhamomyces ciferrii (strain ATCC 14091 / BCRC 22168 / CBS 111 / JCM 3599 / NBRC 0793 / NRRL Y-1031 F-60-10) TaxID=1206466 RepID=K0KXR7_WICCF|nr:uncharacterized protein BN7_5445 [Wickerhamomyces ciferrii]CCH45858.1 hypothetical protein BN7_5445 [Wickerhamomyces ciferrii]